VGLLRKILLGIRTSRNRNPASLLTGLRMLFLLQAFSISQIATAYCDAGQNYKNLVGYVKGLSE